MEHNNRMKKIQLTSGDYAIIDDELYDELSKITWMLGNRGYAYMKKYLGKIDGKYKYKTILMHRYIMGVKTGKQLDHINGNRLDNRCSNLRFCNQKENMANSRKPSTNTSGYKGVTWDRQRSKWVAYIYRGKSINLGGFTTKEEAHLAYIDAAKRYSGKFARWE